MQIDWFTTAAQIVNFLILVWLLKKFLYVPVLNAMERRQQKIAARLQEASDKELLAEEEKKRYLALQKEEKDRARQEFEAARARAEEFRLELFAEIKKEAEAARKEWQESLAREKDLFLEQTGRLFTKQFQQLSRAAFKELAAGSVEETIIHIFWKNLEKNNEVREAFFQKITQGEPLTVTTAFALSDALKEKMSTLNRTLFEAEATLLFERDESLIAGISIEAGGKKICWDFRHYLEGFTGELNLALEKEING